jgi:hypothetical protein
MQFALANRIAPPLIDASKREIHMELVKLDKPSAPAVHKDDDHRKIILGNTESTKVTILQRSRAWTSSKLRSNLSSKLPSL